jgi:hypothetical protein
MEKYKWLEYLLTCFGVFFIFDLKKVFWYKIKVKLDFVFEIVG